MAKLKSKEYDYTGQLGFGNSIIYRPLIEVNVSSGIGARGLSVLALIDSGTDGTLFNVEMAKALGIDISKCKRVKVGGIGEREGFICNVKLTVPDFRLSMDIEVIFVDQLPFDGLLGQRHFFEKFRIKFEKDRNKFYLALVR